MGPRVPLSPYMINGCLEYHSQKNEIHKCVVSLQKVPERIRPVRRGIVSEQRSSGLNPDRVAVRTSEKEIITSFSPFSTKNTSLLHISHILMRPPVESLFLMASQTMKEKRGIPCENQTTLHQSTRLALVRIWSYVLEEEQCLQNSSSACLRSTTSSPKSGWGMGVDKILVKRGIKEE